MRCTSAAVLCLLAGTSAIAIDQGKQLRQKSSGASFISSLEFQRVLRVCNAFPFSHPLDVYLGKEKLTTKDGPLPYKQCAEFRPDLKANDKIEFKVDDSSSAGSFSVSELPSNDATLVLVIYRHDTISTGVSFESHVFSNLANAQVAVIDTYRGSAKATPRIQDYKKKKDPNQQVRSEELRFDSVMAVNPGVYELTLENTAGNVTAKHELVAQDHESYMVMRVGLEAESGTSYPQEIMVFPMSDPAQFSGAATAMPAIFAAVLGMLAMA
jgi:hypothetical protein